MARDDIVGGDRGVTLGVTLYVPPRNPKKAPRPQPSIEPQMIAKGRGLRGRYLEQVNERLLRRAR
jgi:hypothetical protein